MNRFRHFVAIDWSGAKGERHGSIAVASCGLGDDAPTITAPPAGGWSRQEVLELLKHGLPEATLVGLDLGTSLAFADCGAFFPGWECSPPDAKALWRLVERYCTEDDHLGAECLGFCAYPRANRAGGPKEAFRWVPNDAIDGGCGGVRRRNDPYLVGGVCDEVPQVGLNPAPIRREVVGDEQVLHGVATAARSARRRMAHSACSRSISSSPRS